MTYEDLLREVEKEEIEVFENNRIGKLKGLYVDNTITLNTNIDTEIEKIGVLAEELGHYHTSSGDIRDQSKVENRKQEIKARRWGYERLMDISKIIEAKKAGIRNRYELADYLNVEEQFLEDALKYYKEKYGNRCFVDKYIIQFDPLEVYENVYDKIDLK